ncbi:MAG: hypothetical protein M0006_16760 [Magnetospirillum sp.]|nr:hypothetical protein [Magnetospirillum sp.]
MTTTRPVTEADFLAYVDGRLDAVRQAEVETHLRAVPEDGERVAADIAIQAGLRLLFGDRDGQRREGAGGKGARRAPWPKRTALTFALIAGAFVGGWCMARIGSDAAVPAAYLR